MDVTQLKTQRKSLRTSTLSAKVIEEELMKEVPDVDELSILKMQISDKFSRLGKCQTDKFQYLLQAVVSNSKAARVAESFPATADNYPKRMYVRDLLSMVMRNVATGRSKTDLSALYDELEAKIRALESLGRTQDNYGEFLSPSVESCLLEDILLAFERSKNFKEDTPGKGRSLKLLMNFLKQEVKNDEMVKLDRNNFSAPVNQKKKEVNKPDKFPSAATLVSTHDRNGTDDYKVVFKEWEELEVIEKIEDKGENSYFLPHRLIVKNDSITTKIRTVFDASARVTGQISLNDLLYKGTNLIEQVPDILDRFRRYHIGFSADIEKAFLKLGIIPKHRDFLRFFYLDEGEETVYRHCRVVFGVSSSPFLLAAVLVHLLENVPADDTQLGSKLKLSFYVDNCVAGVNDIAQQKEFV
ncbi:DUF1758 domain-containing protein [Trichonephila clavipes]|nr:DUF1758 domain-containing protein [Trichonephila clavipes]